MQGPAPGDGAEGDCHDDKEGRAAMSNPDAAEGGLLARAVHRGPWRRRPYLAAQNQLTATTPMPQQYHANQCSRAARTTRMRKSSAT